MPSDKLLRIVITGDAKGALGAFAETEAGAGKLGGSFGKLGSAAVAGGAVAAAAFVGVGVALYDIGSKFDEAYDKIRVGTGQTGAGLDALKDDFRNVVQSVPTDFGKASDAITAVAQRLGDSGPRVQGLSKQFLELSRITGTDLPGNTKAGLDAIMNWNIEGDQMGVSMDELFRTSQLTGASFGDLATQVSSNGPVLRALGLSFEDAAALAGTLAQNGLNLTDVMPALSKSLATAGKEGKSAGDLFRETFDNIKNAPTDTEAAGDALQVFGAKAGPKLAELVREGKLSYDDLKNSIMGGKDTILGAGQDTQDFAEKWEMFKNRVLVALEPIAKRVFDGMGKAMDKLGPVASEVAKAFSEQGLGGALRVLGQHFANLSPTLKVAIAGLVALGVALWAAFAPVSLIAVGIAALVGGLVYAYTHFETFRNVVDAVSKWLVEVAWPAMVTVFNGIVSAVQATITFVQNNWHYVQTAFETVANALSAAWTNVGQPVFSAIVTAVQDAVSFFQTIWPGVSAAFGAVWGAMQTAWDSFGHPIFIGITEAASTVIGWFQTTWSLVTDAFEAVWHAVSWAWDHVGAPIFETIKKIVGGVLDAINAVKDGWNAIKDIPTVAIHGTGVPTVNNDPNSITGIGPHRAMGGPVRAGMPYIVGERRPELFVPDSNGTILPSLPGVGGGGDVIHVHLHGPVIGSDLRKAAEQLAEPIQRVLLKKQNRNPVASLGMS